MDRRAIQPTVAGPRWPMTGEARLALIDELERLRRDVAGAFIPSDGLIHLPVARAERRLEVLSAVLDLADEVDAPDLVIIGRRVTLREADGETVTFSLVFPGDGEPAQGWISADSPLGSAVLGHRPGDVVEVVAPAGRRSVTIVAVD